MGDLGVADRLAEMARADCRSSENFISCVEVEAFTGRIEGTLRELHEYVRQHLGLDPTRLVVTKDSVRLGWLIYTRDSLLG